jgi:hypothetical protein
VYYGGMAWANETPGGRWLVGRSIDIKLECTFQQFPWIPQGGRQKQWASLGVEFGYGPVGRDMYGPQRAAGNRFWVSLFMFSISSFFNLHSLNYSL